MAVVETVAALEAAAQRAREELDVCIDGDQSESNAARQGSFIELMESKGMRVLGMTYKIPVEEARMLRWKLLPPKPGDGNEQAVILKLIQGDKLGFTAVRKLGTDFDIIPAEGNQKPVMERILACLNNGAENFTIDRMKEEWHRSAPHVGVSAEKAEVVEASMDSLRGTLLQRKLSKRCGTWAHSLCMFRMN